jgi:CxxC motif-containing protein (DUF1111 family)
MTPRTFLRYLIVTLLLALPGTVLGKSPDAIGDPLPNLKPVESSFFNNGKTQFNRVWGLHEGVGPVFTDAACSRCHRVPTIGGGSERRITYFGRIDDDGSFDPLDGTGPSGLNEGGILLQPLSTKPFLPNCSQGGEIVPPDANVTEKRLTSPTFGFGLIDAIADQQLLTQATFELNNYQADGIHGVATVVGTYYTAAPNKAGRFGWKAQIANLVEMTAFEFANELGITNPLFINEDLPQGQPLDPNCVVNTLVPNNGDSGSGGEGIFPLSHFMRYLAPATPSPNCPNGDCAHGQTVFTQIGCAECHKQSYITPQGVRVPVDLGGDSFLSPALSNQTVSLYSDLLVHDLGNADKGFIPEKQVITGQATLSQWRTTPLWGLQYRTSYMHNGGARDLDTAIRGHSDGLTGEAVTVIERYKALSPADQQSLLDFLGTL